MPCLLVRRFRDPPREPHWATQRGAGGEDKQQLPAGLNMKKAEGFGFVLLLGIVGNILSVVGVVICNKLIMTRGFHFTMILSAMHFAVTWLGCCILLQFKYFKYKQIAFFDALPVASVSAVRMRTRKGDGNGRSKVDCTLAIR